MIWLHLGKKGHCTLLKTTQPGVIQTNQIHFRSTATYLKKNQGGQLHSVLDLRGIPPWYLSTPTPKFVALTPEKIVKISQKYIAAPLSGFPTNRVLKMVPGFITLGTSLAARNNISNLSSSTQC